MPKLKQKTPIRFKSNSFPIQFSADGKGLPMFSMTAYTGAAVLLEFSETPVVIDLATLKIPDKPMAILHEHWRFEKVGHSTAIKKTDKEIFIEGVVSCTGPAAEDVATSGRNGFPWQASVGCDNGYYERIQDGESITVNGMKFEGPIDVYRDGELVETSFCVFGADSQTSAFVASKKRKGVVMTIKDIAAQFKKWIGTPDGRKSIQAAAKPDDEKEKDTEASEGEDETEDEEDEESAEASEGDEDDDEEEEEEAEASKDKPKPKQSRPISAPSIIPRPKLGRAGNPAHRQGGPRMERVIEASLLQVAGLSGKQVEGSGYDQKEIDLSMSRDYRGLRLSTLMNMSIQASGLNWSGNIRTDDHIEIFFRANRRLRERGIQASGMGAGGFTTVNVPGILSNVANKTLLGAYSLIAENGIALKLSSVGSASDFKDLHSYQFDMSGELVAIQQGSNLSHLGFIETERTNRVRTRGGIVTLTREMMINDDLNAFLRIPQQFGTKAALALEKAWFTTFFSNLTNLFNSGNNNVSTGALSITGLGDVVTKFMEIKGLADKDGNSDFILVNPKHLLVPPRLLPMAKAIFTSTTVNETTATNKPNPVDNIYAGMFDPVSSPYLGSAGGFGGTDTNSGSSPIRTLSHSLKFCS